MSLMKSMRSDEQLIDTFLTGEKEDSDAAFEALVKRHGPMVLGVCRHVLTQEPDAEDAFQATFLALAQGRHHPEPRDPGVLAARGRLPNRDPSAASSRPILPADGTQEIEESHAGPASAASRNELRLLVRAEVDGLPAKYRSLVLHTYIEGKSNEQVARLLRCPVGTVKGQLSRARDILRARLYRRGWDQDDVRYRWG